MPLLKIKYTGDTLTAEKGTKRVHSHTYFATSDDPQMTTMAVTSDPLCPKEMQPDEYDRLATIVSVTAKRRGPHQLRTWEITVTSTTEVEYAVNPVTQPAKWSVQTVLYEVPAIRDRDDQPIVNKAGQLIQGAVKTILGFTFVGRFSIEDGPIQWLDTFADATNDASISIKGRRCPKETLWLRDVGISEPQKDNGFTHCPTSITIEYNPLGFDYLPLNMGYMEVISSTFTRSAGRRGTAGRRYTIRQLVEILDDNGQPVSEKQMLDENGSRHRVADANGVMRVKHPLDAADIITLKFPVKKLASFGDLPIRWN